MIRINILEISKRKQSCMDSFLINKSVKQRSLRHSEWRKRWQFRAGFLCGENSQRKKVSTVHTKAWSTIFSL